jgi:aminoglycoside phosphotransferase (APT) family kinase protein
MMLAVKALLPTVVDCRDEPLGVIRIETTNPVYLVFGADVQQPRWVVRFAPEDRVTRSEELLQALQSAASDLVPHALGSCPAGAQQFMQVQSGLPGHPWFRLRHRLTTVAQWNDLRKSARTALARLHAAIRTNDSWLKEFDVSAELRSSWEAARGYGLDNPQIDAAVQRALDASAGRRIPSFAQHGDFCINNLLIDGDTARVLDFEEFGLTFAPLHDEFSLALSFDEMAPATASQSLSDQVAFVLDRPEIAEAALSELAMPLWLNHLLWRFVTSHQIANRRGLVQRWLSVLEHSVAHANAQSTGFRS